MILFYFLFLLPIHVYSGDDFWPSYRSSVMEGDKPILRGSGPEPGVVVNDENAVSDNARSKINQRYLNPDHDPEMIRNYGLFLGWLMNTYGYAISDSRRQGKEYLDAEDSLKIHSDKRDKHKKKHRKNKKKKKQRKGIERTLPKNTMNSDSYEYENENSENRLDENDMILTGKKEWGNAIENQYLSSSTKQNAVANEDKNKSSILSNVKDFIYSMVQEVTAQDKTPTASEHYSDVRSGISENNSKNFTLRLYLTS